MLFLPKQFSNCNTIEHVMAHKKSSKTESTDHSNQQFVFNKTNYQLMLAGLLTIIIGFVLMYGKEDIYDFRKTTLAPMVVILGFVIEIFAIMKKPKK
jgi:hypothetical protein